MRGVNLGRRHWIIGCALWIGSVILMGCTRPVQAERADLPILAINRDLTVDKPVSYENQHLKIQGNVYLEKGGELTLTNCIAGSRRDSASSTLP